jgi:hypothetical protein
MSSPNSNPGRGKPPTPRQLSYLRALAQQTGTTFTPPQTNKEASRMIETMRRRKRTPRSDLGRERRAVAYDMATRIGGSARVRPQEIHGYGPSASWTPPPKVKTPRPGPCAVNCKHDSYDVLVDRTTKWGNPFRVGIHGTREECIAKHEAWLPIQPHLIAALHELRGKRLGCHCHPKPCHADHLAELANAPADPQQSTRRRPAARSSASSDVVDACPDRS